VTSYTASLKYPRWRDLSKRHKITRECLENRLKSFFFSNEPVAPAAIVGPYGSGKTELMFHGFRHVWNDLKKTAFYMNLETLLDLLPDDLSPGLLYEEIWKIIENQIAILRQVLEGSEQKLKLYLPGLEESESLENYFEHVHINFEAVKEAIKNDDAVLFVDEMEQHYKELRERLKTSDLSPLRSFLEKVEQKREKPRYYVVMSFALGSAYEAIGGAEARRKNTIPMPLSEPEEFATLTQNSKYRNLFWWSSRGRPGWAIQMWDSWGKHIEEAQRIDDEMLRRFFHERIEGLPYLDTSKINQLITGLNSQALKSIIIDLKPFAKESLVPSTEAIFDSLGFHYVLVSDTLTPEEQILEALLIDLKKISSPYKPNWMIIRDYLRRILIATSDLGKIAFGGWKSESDAFAIATVAPLLLILHDIVLEFEGDTEEGKETWNFLHGLVAELKAADVTPDISKVTAMFGATKKLFKSYYDETQVGWIQASFKLTEELFPRLVVKPLLILSDAAKEDIQSQGLHLQGAVQSGNVFLTQSFKVDDIIVRFIFTPSSSCLPRLQDVHLSPMNRDTYLPYEQVIAILGLNAGEMLSLDHSKNSELRVIEELNKIHVSQLEERQLADFIVSLWHNMLVSNEEFAGDLLDIMEKLQASAKITKNTRRTIEYYTDLIHDRFNILARIIADQYRNVVCEVFPYRTADFPEQRINDTADKIQETRATEQVAVAFDLFLDKTRSADTLAALRQMKQLLERPKPPHGYKEFFDLYTVSQKPPQPSAAIRPVIEFIKKYNSFGKLRDYVKELPYDIDISPDFMDLTEKVSNSPPERMFGWSPQSKIFLRGLYLRVFVENHKNELLNEVSNLLASLRDTEKRFKGLLEDINSFNRALGKNVLSTKITRDIVKELALACQFVEGAKELPPAVLYVTYRFLNAAVKKVEEDRQRWTGVAGIEAWRSKFEHVIKIDDYIQAARQRLQVIYSANTEFKENDIGKYEVVLKKEITTKLKSAIDQVLSEVGDETYELDESPPDVDLERLQEVQENIDNYLNDIETKSQKIDEICGLLSRLQSKLDNLYKGMIQ
jgi:hypothetical protein